MHAKMAYSYANCCVCFDHWLFCFLQINDCGVFSGMYVAWPGQRLEISSKDSICKDGTFMLPGNSFEPPKEVIIDWKYVYWLEKREEVTIKPQWGPCGWYYPNNTAALCDGTDETTQHVFDNVSPEKLPPPPTQVRSRKYIASWEA